MKLFLVALIVPMLVTAMERHDFEIIDETEGFTVYLDGGTGLVWSDKFSAQTFYDAKTVCARKGPEMGSLQTLDWKLPSREEYAEAEENGIRKVLPGMNGFFWTATARYPERAKEGDFQDEYMIYNGSVGNFAVLDQNDKIYVRCVARWKRSWWDILIDMCF